LPEVPVRDPALRQGLKTGGYVLKQGQEDRLRSKVEGGKGKEICSYRK
jgi:hypothetical protein